MKGYKGYTIIGKLPNMLCGIRLFLSPVLIVLSLKGEEILFLVFLGISFLTDALDGLIARFLKVNSKLGSTLDSLGDIAIYISTPICAWFLWPEIVIREIFYGVLAILSFLVSLIIGIIRFGRVPALHTWGAKLTAILMSFSLYLLFLDINKWPFRVTSILSCLVAIEESIIILLSPVWQPNIPSLYHFLRWRNRK